MHEIVITQGIVLGKRNIRESDVVVALFTPYGLLRAHARGARKEESKLRFGLEPLTRGRYSLVKTRREWRLTGAGEISRAFAQSGSAARIARLLLRLMPGQEPSPELFAVVLEGLDMLVKAGEQKAKVESIEVIVVLRILSHLGYLPHTQALAPFVEGEFTLELSAKALEARGMLVRAINESLRTTGL